MLPYCFNGTDCPYLTSAGSCGYTGNGCTKYETAKFYTVKIPDKPQYSITQPVDLSDESIERITDAVVKKLYQIKGEKDEQK